VADALDELGMVEPLFKTQPFFTIHFRRVNELVKEIEQNHFGEIFGMYLHYEMNLTFDKIVRLTQAACKKFDTSLDRYCSKILLFNPYIKGEVIKVPRLAPPKNKLAASKKAIYRGHAQRAVERGGSTSFCSHPRRHPTTTSP